MPEARASFTPALESSFQLWYAPSPHFKDELRDVGLQKMIKLPRIAVLGQ